MNVGFDDNLALRGELHRVADQIHEDLPHAQRVADEVARLALRRAGDQGDALGLRGARKQTGALLHDAPQLQRQLLQHDLAGIDLG